MGEARLGGAAGGGGCWRGHCREARVLGFRTAEGLSLR